MNLLNGEGIHAVFHYVPLHSSPVGHGLGYRNGDLPVTEEISGRLLRLPVFAGTTKDEWEFIKKNVISTFSRLL
jgi:dTDP-4-amino-4,6-dideoxygalactose transaminase